MTAIGRSSSLTAPTQVQTPEAPSGVDQAAAPSPAPAPPADSFASAPNGAGPVLAPPPPGEVKDEFSLAPSQTFRGVCDLVANAVKPRPVEATYADQGDAGVAAGTSPTGKQPPGGPPITAELSRGDWDKAVELATAEKDPVQRDLMLGALKKMKAQGEVLAKAAGMPADGPIPLTAQTAALLNRGTPQLYQEQGQKMLAQFTPPPGLSGETKAQLREFLVRYATDPVFDQTIQKHGSVLGGARADLAQAAAGDRTLNTVDGLLGQCNETQAQSAAVFADFKASWQARHPDQPLQLDGFPVSENVKLKYFPNLGDIFQGKAQLGLEVKGAHELFGVRTADGQTLYLDPWTNQRNDAKSVQTREAYAGKWMPGLSFTETDGAGKSTTLSVDDIKRLARRSISP